MTEYRSVKGLVISVVCWFVFITSTGIEPIFRKRWWILVFGRVIIYYICFIFFFLIIPLVVFAFTIFLESDFLILLFRTIISWLSTFRTWYRWISWLWFDKTLGFRHKGVIRDGMFSRFVEIIISYFSAGSSRCVEIRGLI